MRRGLSVPTRRALTLGFGVATGLLAAWLWTRDDPTPPPSPAVAADPEPAATDEETSPPPAPPDALPSDCDTLAERAVEVAEALNEKACIEAGRALRELERQRDLAAKGVISDDALDKVESAHQLAVTACAAARAQVRQAQAAVEVDRHQRVEAEVAVHSLLPLNR